MSLLQELSDELDATASHLQLAYDKCHELNQLENSPTSQVMAVQTAKALRKSAEALGFQLRGPLSAPTGLSFAGLGDEEEP